MKPTYPIAIVLTCVVAACGDKTPPAPNTPKPKVEAVTPAAATPMPPAAPSAAPASAGQDAPKK